MRTAARVGAVAFVTLVAHLVLLSKVHPQGVRPDALLLLAVVGGIVGGAERGAVLGFVSGLLADLFLQSPFGLTALVFSLVGFAVGSFQSGILRSAWWISVAIALVASAAGIVLYALVGAMVGQTDMVQPRLPVIAALVAVLNAVLTLPAVRLVAWAFGAGPSTR